MSEATAKQLETESALQIADRVKYAYRIALFCGAGPLVVGVSIFLLWLATRWVWLMLAGLFTIYGGLVIFIIGAIALGRYFWLARDEPGLTKKRLWFKALGGAALLLSNFVVAGTIMVSIFYLDGWMSETHTQQITRVTEPAKLVFHADDARNKSGATLHVHGHIDGAATIQGPLGEHGPKPITGDVELIFGGDYFESDIEFEYAPTKVTGGQLTFELTFQ